MNREFVIKMMQAKKLEYEALKEILPESVESRINNLENEVFSMVKDYIVTELTKEGSCMKQWEENMTTDKKADESTEKPIEKRTQKSGKKKVQKVTIES